MKERKETKHPNSDFVNVDVAWKEIISCQWIDNQLKLDVDDSGAWTDCFVYVLQLGGSATMNFDRKPFLLGKNDMIMFPPNVEPSLTDPSDDYSAICLILNEQFCKENVMMRKGLCSSVYSYTQMKEHKVHITDEQAKIIEADIRLLIMHIENPNSQTQTSLEGLFCTFLADIIDILANTTGVMKEPSRAYDIFTGFTNLLRKDFREEHSVNYYADKLNISQRYLSMAVREVSNQSVTYFINQMLMLEACWMLRSTTYNVQEITDQLHFSGATVFCKFFKRHSGMSPLAYRDSQPSKPNASDPLGK